MALLLTMALAGPALAQDQRADPAASLADAAWLERAFADPPAAARPRVWWHWLNGNVTKDGIRKDLEWMKRTGIAGLQHFDASIETPVIVDERLVFMTPAWKDAFRFAASEADRLGLEMAIAASPGWSETGGPWVKPQDGMKKIVWSETAVQGGRPFRGRLPRPPETTGPFRDAPPQSFIAPLVPQKTVPSHYQDEVVFAYRAPAGAAPLEPRVTVAGKPLDAGVLSDGSFTTGLVLPRGSAAAPTIVELTLDRPQPVRSITLFMRGGFRLYQPGIVIPRTEYSTDGSAWRRLADVPPGNVPTTIAVPALEARFFRVVLVVLGADGLAGDAGAAAGVDRSPFDVFKGRPEVELVELSLSAEPRIDRWEAKAGFGSMPDRYAPPAGIDPQEAGIGPVDLVDLTGRVGADGTLDWTPPAGAWRIVRLGGSLVGTTNHPAVPEATGLEVDKLDRAAVRRYLETYLDLYRAAAGPELMGQRGVQALLTDSTEIGAFNWTPGLLDHFQRLRGYDPRPWLPALTGVIVGSRERSDAFLYDFRRTLGELHASEHYGTVATVAHERGLRVYGESLEGGAGTPGDDLDMRRFTDVPMAALWTYPRGGKPAPQNEADMRGAASVAHFYGQNIVAAESLTAAANPWAYAPADLRRIVDLIFANGVNRPILHTSVHAPRDDRQPGLSLWIYGQYFNRLETWAEMARPWIDYIARSSLLLQAGRPVADVAYVYGEERPIAALAAGGLPADLPTRYAYDFVSAKAVLEDIGVESGDLVAPSGARYRVLQLGGTSARMTLPMLRRIADLAEQGATIVGDAPKGSPSLAHDEAEYAALVQRLWPGGEATAVGKGRVIAGRDVEAALARIGVAPDFALEEPRPDAPILFVHRRIREGDIYFVANRGRAQQVEVRFRVKGKAPELWRADSATIRPASYRIEGDQTVVPLDLGAEDSVFVVFRRDAAAASRSVPAETVGVIAEVDGPWAVSFQAGRGAPGSAPMAQLRSLSEHAERGIGYFSGVATYRKTIEAPRSHAPGKPLWLDLGAVGDVAEVRVNGQVAGIAWQAPYRVDIGRFIKRGRNALEVRVANLWVNRLIGDAQPGAERITFTVTPTYTADAPLRPSGLIGPVRLLTAGPAK